ncbi:MAG: peptidoglycan DD-metalloendopeptidase family protein [Thiobacillaceae bacterium]
MRFAAVVLLGLLAGCETVVAPIDDVTRAPSSSPATRQAGPTTTNPRGESARLAPGSMYTVQKGDTLFSIAFANGLDFRELAVWNDLAPPYVIKIGQVLRLTSPASGLSSPSSVQTIPIAQREPERRPLPEIPLYTAPQAESMPWSDANWAKVNRDDRKPPPAPEVASMPEKAAGTVEVKPAITEKGESRVGPSTWIWPAPGPLLGRYGESGGKGVDLAGARGTPIVATAAGKVVYSGSGLRGYGQLVIIKHANEYLSAYAHNQKVLVREGEQVSGGQEIAEMGDTDTDRVKLHFEIRQFGKPIDPLKLLPDRL